MSEIVARIRKGSLNTASELLVDECTRRMQYPEINQPSKPDDMTFILYRRTQ